jgi:hypothetical protein
MKMIAQCRTSFLSEFPQVRRSGQAILMNSKRIHELFRIVIFNGKNSAVVLGRVSIGSRAGLFPVGKRGLARDVLGPCLSPFPDATCQARGNGDRHAPKTPRASPHFPCPDENETALGSRGSRVVGGQNLRVAAICRFRSLIVTMTLKLPATSPGSNLSVWPVIEIVSTELIELWIILAATLGRHSSVSARGLQ